MVEIKEGYKNQFNVVLADDIKKNYTGNTSKILLALIKGKGVMYKTSVKFYAEDYSYLKVSEKNPNRNVCKNDTH
jgi:hypothetical protein